MSSIYRNGQFYGQTSNPINDAETSLVKTWSSEFIAKFVGDNVDAIVEEIDSLEYSGLAPEIQNNGTVYFITDRGVIYHNGIEYGKPVIEPSQVYTKSETDSLLEQKADANEVYSKTEADELLNGKANSSEVYSKNEADELLNKKTNSDDVYSKTEIDTMFGDVESVLATVVEV